MIEGKTKSGFKYMLEESTLEDWDVFEAIADMSSNDAAKVIKGTKNFVDLVLRDDKNRLVEHIRKKNDGKCTIQMMSKEINDIVIGAKEIKNSSSSQG